MRVRIHLLDPFPSSKILLPVPTEATTINDLKKHILKSISSIAGVVDKSKDLILEIEGFELLGGSKLDILQYGDVVSVKPTPGGSNQDILAPRPKRKARLSEPQRLPNVLKKLKTSEVRAVSAPLNRRLSVSSSSSSSSSSDTISSSSSSSISSSSSSASSKSAPNLESGTLHSKPLVVKESFPVRSNPKPLTQPQSAPGEGLNRTKNRNARKRKALLMRKIENEPLPTLGSKTTENLATIQPSADDHFLATITAHSASEAADEATIWQISSARDMANRNKKKGFLQEMSNMRSVKTTFSDSPSTSLPYPSGLDDTATPRRYQHVTVVPPSEEVDIPSNVFVTSKEYDWRTKTPHKLPKRFDRIESPEARITTDEAVLNGGSYLNHIEQSAGGEDQLWQEAQDQFESLTTLTSLDQVGNGAVIAWKNLELDPRTFSPELVLRIGRISVADGNYILKILESPQDRHAEEEEQSAEEIWHHMEVDESTVAFTNKDILRDGGRYRILSAGQV